jgi:hypothetical protein
MTRAEVFPDDDLDPGRAARGWRGAAPTSTGRRRRASPSRPCVLREAVGRPADCEFNMTVLAAAAAVPPREEG